jgi:hypothetical protein
MQYAKRFFNRNALLQAVKVVKEKYCPTGETCEVIIMLGIMIGFMYTAMLPLANPMS